MPATINADNGVVSGSAGVKTTADTSGVLALQSNGTTGLTLTTGLNVGIGTSSPTSKLVVQQSQNTGDGIRLLANGSDTALLTRYLSSIDAWQITSSYGTTGAYKPIAWFTSDLERMRLDVNGNLGIGTTSPVAKFDLVGNYREGVVTANTGTAYTINLANGTVQYLTLTGNCTYTFPTPVAGLSFILIQRQDGTGGRTVTWPASVDWPGATAPTLTSTANRVDKFVFTAIDGSNWLGSNAGQNYTV
jgi:hypothetical protein